MKDKKNDINIKISPFFLVEHGNNLVSLCLCTGIYKKDLFETRINGGIDGNGYVWDSLAKIFLQKMMPELLDKVKFDLESSMFCAFSENKNAILEFAITFHKMCEDESLMRELISRVELD